MSSNDLLFDLEMASVRKSNSFVDLSSFRECKQYLC